MSASLFWAQTNGFASARSRAALGGVARGGDTHWQDHADYLTAERIA